MASLRGVFNRYDIEDKEFNRVSAYPQAFPTGGMTGLNGAWARGSAKSFADFRAWPRGQSGCRLSFVRQLWADGALDEQFLYSGQALVPQIGQENLEKDYALRGLLSLQKYLFRIPAFRRLVGRMVLAEEEIDLKRLPGFPPPAPAGK